jgi:hypothetical protein
MAEGIAVEVYLLRAQRRLALRPPSSDIATPCCSYVLLMQQCVPLQIRPAAAAKAAQVFRTSDRCPGRGCYQASSRFPTACNTCWERCEVCWTLRSNDGWACCYARSAARAREAWRESLVLSTVYQGDCRTDCHNQAISHSAGSVRHSSFVSGTPRRCCPPCPTPANVRLDAGEPSST